MIGSSLRAPERPARDRALWWSSVAATFVAAVLAALVLLPAAEAQAGLSSTGKLAFYPCKRCHPVFLGADGKPTKPLPIGLEKHEIELQVHDILGVGDKACLACHQSPTIDPGQLILPDGTLVEVTGDISRVCQRCHFEKYAEWKAGMHGKDQPKCSAAGCHNPHSPSWIYVPALPPFLGTGIEVHAVSEREGFKPLASPPIPPPVETPLWLSIITAIGVTVSGGIVGILIKGRRRQ